MNERKLSELQKEYRAFFLERMRLYGIKSPAELTKEEKSKFFTEIKLIWAKINVAKQQTKEDIKRKATTTSERQKQLVQDKTINPTKVKLSNHEFRQEQRQKQGQPSHAKNITEQVIKSEPNKEQTDYLKILFTPNNHFAQDVNYLYPVVKMPKPNCSLKLPRTGRSNQKGYKENDFYNEIKIQTSDIEISNNVHMVIPGYNKPYEPDIVLFYRNIHLYIDIEIDEPYDGYYRYPTHSINPEEDFKQDNIRDLFFTESGWIVIRFTEKQVHCQAKECIDYIKNVINSIYGRDFTTAVCCEIENQWDYNQCIQWQKIYYREKYLGIERFQKQYNYKEIEVDTEEDESIERILQRTRRYNFETWNRSIAFDEETHKYFHPKDETGNAEYISVTTLIERFFPFDLKRYIERKSIEDERTEEDVFIEYLMIRDEAADKGTFLHHQIENYLKGNNFDSDLREFEFFLNFYSKEIKKRNLVYFDAERMIFSRKYNVAGTIDCLFKKSDKDEYVMLDWKRSKKLIIDGRPKIFGFGYALSELSNLDNSSYNRYCLQQNVYKYILESECSMKVSSMKLVVLHDNYSDYFVVDVPEKKRETRIILNSLKHKI